MSEKFLYLPDGSKHVIYPPHYVPETPLCPQIVFPDKTTANVDWRRNFDRVIETQKVLKEANIGQEEATVKPDLEYPQLPMLLAVISDAHMFSAETDHELLKRHLDMVLQYPNVRMLDLGDDVDMGVWGQLVFEQMLTPAMQGFTMKDLAREMQNRLLAIVGGNHNDFMKNIGTEFYDAFLREAKCPVMPAGGMIHLELPGQKYDVAVKHMHWGASKLNITNPAKRFIQFDYPDADVALLGHTHQSSIEQFYLGGKSRLAAVGGTYKLDDQWAKRRGMTSRPDRGGLGILLYPDKREMIPFLQLEDGLEYLRTLAEVKNLKFP